jgi:hypothetical protein
MWFEWQKLRSTKWSSKDKNFDLLIAFEKSRSTNAVWKTNTLIYCTLIDLRQEEPYSRPSFYSFWSLTTILDIRKRIARTEVSKLPNFMLCYVSGGFVLWWYPLKSEYTTIVETRPLPSSWKWEARHQNATTPTRFIGTLELVRVLHAFL